MLAYSCSKYQMYQVMWTAEIWLGTRQKSVHANTTQLAPSMCSSRYCSTFAHLFSLFLGYPCFFGLLWLFLFNFLIFFSLWSTKELTIENMSLNKWKAWPVENSEDVLKIDKKLVTTKRGSCDQFLAKIKFPKPDRGDEWIRNFF